MRSACSHSTFKLRMPCSTMTSALSYEHGWSGNRAVGGAQTADAAQLTHYERAPLFRVGFNTSARGRRKGAPPWIGQSILAWMCIKQAYLLRSGTPAENW